MNPARKTSVNRELEDDDSDFSLISIYLFIVFFKWKYPDGAFLPQYFSNFTSVTQRGRGKVVFFSLPRVVRRDRGATTDWVWWAPCCLSTRPALVVMSTQQISKKTLEATPRYLAQPSAISMTTTSVCCRCGLTFSSSSSFFPASRFVRVHLGFFSFYRYIYIYKEKERERVL